MSVPHGRALACGAALLALSLPAHADDKSLVNRGNDPFFQISTAIPDCPEPAGPRVDEAEWMRETHHRIEDGNHCYLEGRCRLANAYRYDKEIVESVQRRLQSLSALHWRESSSLWMTVRGRWLLVQGCVAPGFATGPFMDGLRQTADVERVVDQVTATPARGLPYPPFRP